MTLPLADATPWDEIWELLEPALGQTLQMVVISTAITGLLGLLLGVLLHTTGRDGLRPLPPVNALLGLVVGIGRSVPFIVLLAAIIPFTRLVVGTSLGTSAVIVPLVVGMTPFYARVVEQALREVPRGLVEMARAAGASRTQTVRKVVLPEAAPGLVGGLTITLVAIVGFSAMAGTVGGGGLGALAIDYGYNRYDGNVMLATVVLLVVIVQLFQLVGDLLVRRISHR
ncbi:methionine ABC transporter permease [Patulibacter minatonensis]|uniref:methionine ABC transporter permease n=1 Tax=Patulibacter minatonensis TaxID=298163 RepID=UPI00047A1D0C|nr:methionine ABC transporter permease [Patulibacter minatonensis]